MASIVVDHDLKKNIVHQKNPRQVNWNTDVATTDIRNR